MTAALGLKQCQIERQQQQR